jgi:hypothetical protein
VHSDHTRGTRRAPSPALPLRGCTPRRTAATPVSGDAHGSGQQGSRVSTPPPAEHSPANRPAGVTPGGPAGTTNEQGNPAKYLQFAHVGAAPRGTGAPPTSRTAGNAEILGPSCKRSHWPIFSSGVQQFCDRATIGSALADRRTVRARSSLGHLTLPYATRTSSRLADHLRHIQRRRSGPRPCQASGSVQYTPISCRWLCPPTRGDLLHGQPRRFSTPPPRSAAVATAALASLLQRGRRTAPHLSAVSFTGQAEGRPSGAHNCRRPPPLGASGPSQRSNLTRPTGQPPARGSSIPSARVQPSGQPPGARPYPWRGDRGRQGLNLVLAAASDLPST